MRSAFRSPGVPLTSEAGTASVIAGPSNRPMRAGFAENNFVDIAALSNFSDLQSQLVVRLDTASNCGNYMKLV